MPLFAVVVVASEMSPVSNGSKRTDRAWTTGRANGNNGEIAYFPFTHLAGPLVMCAIHLFENMPPFPSLRLYGNTTTAALYCDLAPLLFLNSQSMA